MASKARRPAEPPAAPASRRRPGKAPPVNPVWLKLAMQTPADAHAPVQRKATLGTPGDRHEREADLVADWVLEQAEPTPVGVAPTGIQRMCAACEEEGEGTLQAKRDSSAGGRGQLDTGAAVRTAERGGEPLPRAIRSFFEPRFGRDFSHVRVHTDGEAAEAARGVDARAYTMGNHIVFGAGQYAPSTPEGRRLLAHELTHTVQQSGLSGSASLQRLIQRSCHTVAAKETIYSLAKKYGVTQKALLDANGMAENDTLALGRLLVVPDGKPCMHTVAEDDTLYSISRRYGVAVADIQKANKLTGTTITLGQVLTIPIAGGGSAQQPQQSQPQQPPAQQPQPQPPAQGQQPQPQPPTQAQATVPASSDPGHDPGKDYTSGTLREDSFLRKADKETIQTSGGLQLFFKAGDTVKLISSSDKWVEVEGTAYTKAKTKGAAPVAAGTQKGWIQRVWTSMTMGDYKDVPVDDQTKTYGGLASGDLPKKDVKSVILHQTGGSSGAATLSGYAGRIKSGSTIGAHYLIDENGKITLVVPADRKVSHVGKTKTGYAGVADNPHAIGIEHTGTTTALALPSSAKDTATLKANRDAIQAMAMSPELKKRLTDMKDAELYQVARDNRDPDDTKKQWYVYGDINAAQKRSSFLLASKLMSDFGLAEKDLLPHETVSWKTLGEGENIKEYLTARMAYPGLVTRLEALMKADSKLSGDAALATILSDEKASVAALSVDATAAENSALAAEKASGTPGVATAREALRTAFYGKFWARYTQLAALVKFLDANGSSKPTELSKLTGAWVR